jgi:hypothetical protein
VGENGQHAPVVVVGGLTNWLTPHGYTAWQSVQPDSRFWQFQLTEGGRLLAVSAALIAGTICLVRRRGALRLRLDDPQHPAVGGTTPAFRAGPGRDGRHGPGLADPAGPLGALPGVP